VNTLILVLMTSCPVGADPAWVGQPPAASPNEAPASRPGRFSRFRSRFRRSPQGNDNPATSPSPTGTAGRSVYAPAPPAVTPVAPSANGPGPFRYPTTTEPPLAPDSGPSLMPVPGR
jgi:hypothetical protein